MRSLILATFVAAAAALGVTRPFAPVSAVGPWLDFTQTRPLNPFQCGVPNVTASSVDDDTWALELYYQRDGLGDANYQRVNAHRYRGTWLYGGFVLSSIVAQSTDDAFQDIAAFLSNSNDTARYDGTCAVAPQMSLGAATSLYNFDGAFQAADFQACLETGVDEVTGEVVEPYGAVMSSWKGPGLFNNGTVSYDTHGWMHRFEYAATLSDNNATCSWYYGARRVDAKTRLPASFYTVEMSSLRDCSSVFCDGFLDYQGDALVRRVREHRVSRDLSIATEDSLPTNLVEAFTAPPARYGAVNRIVRNVSFVVSVRQPHLLPLTDTYSLKYRSASLGILGCESPQCGRLLPTGARADMQLQVPWSMHSCTAQCMQLVEATRFSQKVTAAAARFEARLDIVDARLGLLDRIVVIRPVAEETPDDSVPISPTTLCDTTFLAPGQAASCSMAVPAADWDVTLTGVTAVVHSEMVAATTDMGDTCGLGRTTFRGLATWKPGDGWVNASGLSLAVSDMSFTLTNTRTTSQAMVWVCAQMQLRRASAQRLDGVPFPAFNSRAAATRWDGQATPTQAGGRYWVPSAPMWDDGGLLDSACAANPACSGNFPYRMEMAPAKNPVVARFPVLVLVQPVQDRTALVPTSTTPRRASAVAWVLGGWAVAIVLVNTCMLSASTVERIERCKANAIVARRRGPRL
jgi:hypothetical protein